MTAPLVVATNDAAELEEFARMLGALGHDCVAAAAAGVAELPPAAARVHRERASELAALVASAAGRPAVALVSALHVYALDQQPGPRTHDYAGAGATADQHCAKLLAAMKRMPPGQRIALFHASAAVAIPGDETKSVTSTLECEVTQEPRGAGGLLFDAVIQVQDRRTLAEMDDDARDRLGHRGMAIKQLAKFLPD